MKRIILIAAACAALASCTKAETETVNVTEPVSGNSFEKGQTVTLTVSTPGQTKATSALNSETGEVTFKWEQTDSIKVTVDSESATFTVSKLINDGTSAEFTGMMPGSGDSFNVQFPVTDPDLSSQTYVAGGLPQNMMKFTATGCTTSAPFELAPQYSALRLNLYGSKPIGKIVVSDGGESPKTYTLTCGETGTGITPGTTAEDATPFFIVVPAEEYKFSAEIFDNASTPASICKFEPSAAQIFTPGNVLNMPAKEVKKSLPALSGVFTVGAGDDGQAGTSDDVKVHFSRGNLQATYNTSTSSYSWDFAANQYDYIGHNAGNTSIDSQSNGAKVDLFGWSTSATYYGINTSKENPPYSGTFKDWGIAYCESKGITPTTTWRTLSGGSGGEWSYLLSTRTVNGGQGEGKSYQRATIRSDVSGGLWGLIIYPDNYTAQTSATTYTSSDWMTMEKAGCVFLPAAGWRNGSSVSKDYGYYWSSTAYGDNNAYYLFFREIRVDQYDAYRCRGYYVRLVCVAQ